MNIRNNDLFNNLFKSIKERFDVGGKEDEKLYIDMKEAVNNMITAIEIGEKDSAFVGMFLPKMNRIFDEKFPAMAGISCIDNCITLYMNPQLIFMVCENYDDFLSIITHEVYHLVFKHLIPSRNYPDSDRTNIAMDVAINQYICLSQNLENNLITLNNFNNDYNCNALPKREFEYYYDFIPDTSNKIDNTLKEMLDELNKRKENYKNNPTEENQKAIDEQKEKIKEYLKNNYVLRDASKSNTEGKSYSYADELMLQDLVKETLNEAKQRGKIPGNITEALDNYYFKNPILSWKKEFRNIIGSVPYSYRKTMRVKNRRQPERNDLLGRVTDRCINILIAIDTSGSVNNDELMYFFNEIFSIVKDVKTSITVVQCDQTIQNVKKIKSKKEVNNIKISGRGGTCFKPVFEYIKYDLKKIDYPDVIVYFTDGYGEDNIDVNLKPNVPLLWVLTGYTNTLSVKTKAFRNKIRLLNIENKKYL